MLPSPDDTVVFVSTVLLLALLVSVPIVSAAIIVRSLIRGEPPRR